MVVVGVIVGNNIMVLSIFSDKSVFLCLFILDALLINKVLDFTMHSICGGTLNYPTGHILFLG